MTSDDAAQGFTALEPTRIRLSAAVRYKSGAVFRQATERFADGHSR